MTKHIKLPNAIWTYTLSSADLQVYIAISTFANRFGHCFVKQGTIASAAGVSIPTVLRAVKRLSACQLISVGKRYNREGQTVANSYAIAPLSGSFTLVPANVLGYKLPKSVLKVYLYLSRCRANKCLEAVPSLSQMVSVLHMSKRTIVDAINHLSNCLLLHKESYRHKQDGRIGHNRYRVLTAAIRSVLIAVMAACCGTKGKRVALFKRATRGAGNIKHFYKSRIYETLTIVKRFFAFRAVLWRFFIGTILTQQELYSPRLRLQLKVSNITLTKFIRSISIS